MEKLAGRSNGDCLLVRDAECTTGVKCEPCANPRTARRKMEDGGFAGIARVVYDERAHALLYVYQSGCRVIALHGRLAGQLRKKRGQNAGLAGILPPLGFSR
jgi:hypothetical protein